MSTHQSSLAKAVQFLSQNSLKKISVPANEYAELRSQLDAIYESQAVAHFQTDGIILNANPLFLKLLGYELDELVDQHHRMLVTPEYARSEAYGKFWDNLNAGVAQQGAFMRICKNGKDIWLRSSYTPIKDATGTISKIILYAVDISWQLLLNYDFEGQ